MSVSHFPDSCFPKGNNKPDESPHCAANGIRASRDWVTCSRGSVYLYVIHIHDPSAATESILATSQQPPCVSALCHLCAGHERVRGPCGDRPVSSMMASSSNSHIQDNATGLSAHRPVFSSPSMALENRRPSSLFSTNNNTKIHITSPSYARVAVNCAVPWFISTMERIAN